MHRIFIYWINWIKNCETRKIVEMLMRYAASETEIFDECKNCFVLLQEFESFRCQTIGSFFFFLLILLQKSFCPQFFDIILEHLRREIGGIQEARWFYCVLVLHRRAQDVINDFKPFAFFCHVCFELWIGISAQSAAVSIVAWIASSMDSNARSKLLSARSEGRRII